MEFYSPRNPVEVRNEQVEMLLTSGLQLSEKVLKIASELKKEGGAESAAFFIVMNAMHKP